MPCVKLPLIRPRLVNRVAIQDSFQACGLVYISLPPLFQRSIPYASRPSTCLVLHRICQYTSTTFTNHKSKAQSRKMANFEAFEQFLKESTAPGPNRTLSGVIVAAVDPSGRSILLFRLRNLTPTRSNLYPCRRHPIGQPGVSTGGQALQHGYYDVDCFLHEAAYLNCCSAVC